MTDYSPTSSGLPGEPEIAEATPEAIDLATRAELDLSEIEGTGKGGRITKGDVMRALGERTDPEADPDEETPPKSFPPLTVTPVLPPLEKRGVRRPYWVGVMPGEGWARFHRVTVGGITFSRGKSVDNPGNVVRLDDLQAERLLDRVARNVVRRFPGGKPGTFRYIDVDSPKFRSAEGDEPLGCFLFAYPLDPKNPLHRPTNQPRPLTPA